jgi:hypothetical protein
MHKLARGQRNPAIERERDVSTQPKSVSIKNVFITNFEAIWIGI